MDKDIQTCKRCILNSTVPSVTFDEDGICNYCKTHDDFEKEFQLNEIGEKQLNQLLEKVKKVGINRKYDCVVGISGGVDSSYTLYMVKKLGLRPLVVHVDNGWNSEIAEKNVKNITSKLDVDLKRIKPDLEEFKDLQLSFLKASVPDIEIPTDIAIRSALFQVASKKNIKYIFSGTTFRTEGKMPVLWGYGDGIYIKYIQKRFGSRNLRTFPNLTLSKFFYYNFIKKIKRVPFLNLIDYNKEKAKEILKKELNWVDYGAKHYESVYTRFVAGYILPQKFGIDKRIIEYSALVRSNVMTRDDALKKMRENPYKGYEPNIDKEYISKNFGITIDDFEEILSFPPKTFFDYKSYYNFFSKIRLLIKIFSKLRIIPINYYSGKFTAKNPDLD